MNQNVKKVEALRVEDLKAFPVWQYTNASGAVGETAVRPVKRTPVDNLNGRLVGTEVRLANGSFCWALIGNIDVQDVRLTQHFLTLSIFKDGNWFTMARYHDIDTNERGPSNLAAFLGIELNEVFPISYDISGVSLGESTVLTGVIEKEPREKLTRAEIIALAVP